MEFDMSLSPPVRIHVSAIRANFNTIDLYVSDTNTFLRFSVGTGRPPVLSKQYLNQCQNILRLPSYNSRDQLVAAGVDLYESLCSLVNSDTVQTDSLVWNEIDDWKRKCGQFFGIIILIQSRRLRF